MTELRGVLQRCRLSGFTLGYTRQLLSAAFPDGDEEVGLITPSDPAWPPMPSPAANIPAYASSLQSTSVISPDSFGLRLHHSRSFAEEFNEEVSKYRYSLLSNHQVRSYDGVLLDNHQGLGGEHRDDGQQFPSVRASILSNYSIQLGSPTDASTPRLESLQPGEIVCTRTFEISERTQTPPPERCSTPNTPNTLNKQNERDPAFIKTVNALKIQSQIEANNQDTAFIRTMEAMRKSSQNDTPPIASENRPPSMLISTTTTVVETPAQRSASAMSARTDDSKGSFKRRYLSFIDRVRGRADT